MNTTPILEITNLEKHFPIKTGLFNRVSGQVFAVDGVSLSLNKGETLGLVGESGCGKSTVARTIVQLLKPTGGCVKLMGRDLAELSSSELKKVRQKIQIIFQDPFSSLDPRMKAKDIVGELLMVHRSLSRIELDRTVGDLFEKVGLLSDQMENYPHEFSGGQRQRLGIARALSLNPEIIICDEPVSALDVSIQAQIINLLMNLQEEFDISLIFVSHDLAVVKHISHRVAVMYLGRIVETAEKSQLFDKPGHPYTQSLLDAVPIADPSKRRKRHILEGDVPSPIDRPTGCHFHLRCPKASQACREIAPQLEEKSDGHLIACHNL
ncbi:MAG: ABC transporter ATP-binding protein [Candidatus Azotimanducaceae bacterium]